MAAAFGDIKTLKCSFCNESSARLYACKQCSLVSYCGQECQKKDWKRGHKETCGRVAPLIQVQVVTPLKCGFCKATNKRLYACKQCSLVSYCGKECQKNDWKRGHRERCGSEVHHTQLHIHDATSGEAAVADRISLLDEKSYVCMQTFTAGTADERHACIKKVAKDSKAARKSTSGMNDVTRRWAAVFATSRLVILCMANNEFVPARKHVGEFFRLWNLFEVLECSQEQRNIWEVDCHLICMQKNQCVLDAMMLDTENLDTRMRVWALPPGQDKTAQTYALIANVEASQAMYKTLGKDFVHLNFAGRVFMIFTCLYLLVDLGTDTTDGIILAKSFALLDRQMVLCYDMLQNTHIIYDRHAEDEANFRRMVELSSA